MSVSTTDDDWVGEAPWFYEEQGAEPLSVSVATAMAVLVPFLVALFVAVVALIY